jgi:flagellar biosynthesis activator protein FlaF
MTPPPKNPYGAYAAAQNSALPPRHVEAAALTRAANMLEEAIADFDDRDRWEDAIKRNQKLWTVIQFEVARPDHPMPAETLKNLYELSMFVDRQSVKAMVSRDPEDLRPMINVNREIAAGLMG